MVKTYHVPMQSVELFELTANQMARALFSHLVKPVQCCTEVNKEDKTQYVAVPIVATLTMFHWRLAELTLFFPCRLQEPTRGGANVDIRALLTIWQRQPLELVTGGDEDGSGGPGTTTPGVSLATSKEWTTSTPVWYDIFLQVLCLTFH